MDRKKAFKKLLQKHGECAHAIPKTDSNTTNDGRPVLGRCPFMEYAFLLHGSTDCPHFKPKENEQ